MSKKHKKKGKKMTNDKPETSPTGSNEIRSRQRNGS